MIRVGLTGGYATGKSFVANELERLGCRLIYADKLGHEALLPSGEAYQPAVDLFGPEILTDGLIDRKKLGQIVFENPALLDRLSALVHPAVFRAEQELIDRYSRLDPNSVIVVEAAILIESGRRDTFDRIIVTTCSPETQIARAMKRDGLTREQVAARIAKQMPIEEKKGYADYLVDTDHPKEATIARVCDIFAQLKSLAVQS
jgi:dephospho-CoA kinase